MIPAATAEDALYAIGRKRRTGAAKRENLLGNAGSAPKLMRNPAGGFLRKVVAWQELHSEFITGLRRNIWHARENVSHCFWQRLAKVAYIDANLGIAFGG